MCYAEVSSCIVQYTAASKAETSVPKGKWQQNIYKAVNKLCGAENKPTPVRDIITEAVKAVVYDIGPDPKKPKRDSRRDSAKRGLNDLIEAGYVVNNDDLISLSQIVPLQ